MDQPSAYSKCEKCGMTLQTKAEKLEHDKTCTSDGNTGEKKEMVETTAGKGTPTDPVVKSATELVPVVTAPVVADEVARHPL